MKNQVLQALSGSLFSGKSGELYTVITGELAGAKAYFSADAACADPALADLLPELRRSQPCHGELIESNAGQVFCERVKPLPRLCICGGGHISLPLSQIGVLLGFSVTVIDDREEFANSERFPHADEVLCGDFLSCIGRFQGGENDYFVVVTRGHAHDRHCLEQILPGPYVYCGMIGSRTKNQIVFDYMLQHGFSEEQIKSVYAPIGLMLGGQTPAEIAVDIAAQLVQVRAAHGSDSAWDRTLIKAITELDRPSALAVIIRRSGSTPRGPGSRMLVYSDGSIVGSVGGGSSEGEAIVYAKQVIKSGESGLYHCVMTSKNAALEGLICGGELDIFIERIN
jgi:xanthine dehydrogenase accessory factor